MKKNAMLKIAAVLLVAVLLTTCAISSTFAKYVSETKTGTASARVAKWGISVNTTAEGFKEEYVLDSTDTMVLASTKVVAPGTSGVLTFNSTVSGLNDTEVALIVDYTWAVQIGSAFTSNDPFMFHVSTTEKSNIDWETVDKTNLGGLEAKLNSTLQDLEVAATETADQTKTIYIYWAWDFARNDANDTSLGEAAVSGNTTDFSISLSTQVVQDGENYAK